MKKESKIGWSYQKLEGGLSLNAERIRVFMEKFTFSDAKAFKIVVDDSNGKTQTFVFYPIHIVTDEEIML